MKPNMLPQKFKSQVGATLLEVNMVIAIVGLLGFTYVNSAPDRLVSSQWTEMQTEVDQVKLAIGACVLASAGITGECDDPAKVYAHTGYAIRPEFHGHTLAIQPDSAALMVTIAKKDGDCAVIVTPMVKDAHAHWVQKLIGKNCEHISRVQPT